MKTGLKSLVGAILGVFSLCGIVPVLAMPPAEEERVLQLFKRIETAEGVVFIRNSREYNAKDAAEFLRRKCGPRIERYADAVQLVKECVSVSSTSGEAYRIRLGDAAPRLSGEVLAEWLRTPVPKN